MNIIREKKNEIIKLKNRISKLEEDTEALEPSDEENFKLLEKYNLNMVEHIYEEMIPVCYFSEFWASFVPSTQVAEVIRELEEKIKATYDTSATEGE